MKKLFSIAFCLLGAFLFTRNVYASTIFEDNFNLDSNGSFPSKWRIFDNPGGTNCNTDWKVLNGEVGLVVLNSGSCASNIIPKDTEWPTQLTDYVLEVDMRFVQGTDHNLAYRIIPSINQILEIHFQSPNDFILGNWGGNVDVNIPAQYPNGQTYHVKIKVSQTNLEAYINDVLVRKITLTAPIPAGTVGLRVGVGSDPNSETWFDNVKVTTLDDASNDLNVSLLKQTDPLWGGQIYDTANKWATDPSISRWGCALTSAAMVFKYHGINNLPDGNPLDPGTLNSWLKAQKDGYIRNGLVNWIALQRLSKLASHTGTEIFDALEFSRVNSSNVDTLKTDIQNGIPDILQEPGHFVVAKGIQGASFSINDPFYNRTSLNDYGNSFQSIKRFVPSNTDLSYLMFVVDPSVNIVLKDGIGNSIGEVVTENPILDPLNLLGNSVGPLKIIYFSKPPTGNYTIEVTSTNPSQYYLQGYIYDINGNVQTVEKRDVLSLNDKDIFSFSFNKNDNMNISLDQNISFMTLRNDLNAFYFLGQIRKENYKELNEEINEIEKQYNKEHKNVIKKLTELAREISKDKKLNSNVSVVLLDDVQGIINILPKTQYKED